MPFDEEDNDQPSIQSQRVGLKKVSSQQSMFDNMPKKPTQEDFDKKVNQVQERSSSYKMRAAELASQFNQAVSDKTLKQNKNVFAREMERELLTKMVQLAIDVNNDPHEQEGMGSLSWITLLFKTCFAQRDRINQLEFVVTQFEKKLDPTILSGLISKEIQAALDKKKVSE
jgi:hypothetical protein